MEWLFILFVLIGFVMKQTTQKTETKEQMPPFNKDAKLPKQRNKKQKQKHDEVVQQKSPQVQSTRLEKRTAISTIQHVEKTSKQHQTHKKLIIPTSANELTKAFIMAEVLGQPKSKKYIANQISKK